MELFKLSDAKTLSVITCVYNGAWCLDRTLRALSLQEMPSGQWELIFVDNASADGSGELARRLIRKLGIHGTILSESQPGKSFALKKAFSAAQGRFFCIVDDDNLLEPSYLKNAVDFLEQNDYIGLIGGRIVPELALPDVRLEEISRWAKSMLAIRDFGDEVIIGKRPIGAGMAGRTSVMRGIYEQIGTRLPDRVGDGPGGCEDHEKVAVFERFGWQVAYVPSLELTHVIPEERLDASYIESIACSAQRTMAWLTALKNPKSHRSRTAYLIRALAAYLYAAKYLVLQFIPRRIDARLPMAPMWRRFYAAKAHGMLDMASQFIDDSDFLVRVANAPPELRPIAGNGDVQSNCSKSASCRSRDGATVIDT